MPETDGVLVRMFEIRFVCDRAWIEHSHVSLHAWAQQTTVEDAKSRSRQAGHAPHRILQGEDLPLAHIAPENTREGPIVAGMRHILSKQRDSAVGGDHGEWKSENALQVVLGNGVVDG